MFAMLCGVNDNSLMKKQNFVLISFLFLVFAALLSDSAGAATYKSEGAVEAQFKKTGKSRQVLVNVGPGFHINEKAPNKLVIEPGHKSIDPKQKFPHNLVFDLPALKSGSTVEVSAYVCDDALTVCETRAFAWSDEGSSIELKDLKELQAKMIQEKSSMPEGKTSVVVKHGFYQDSLETAMKECEATKKPVMLLFSARWCPGCQRLEKEVWSAGDPRKVLKKFSKVKLDADKFVNQAAMEKYGVRGIPTTLILNCQGEELTRYIDYQPKETLFKSLEAFLAQKNPATASQLMARAEKGDAEAARTLAKRFAQSYSNDNAMKWYAKVPDREKDLEYWQALVGQLSAESEKSSDLTVKTKLKEALAGAIKNFAETPSTLDWRSQLADLQGSETPEGQKTLQDLVDLCNSLMIAPERMQKFNQAEDPGDYRGIESLKVYEAKAEALASLKKTEEEKAAWKAGVSEGARLGLKDDGTGQFLRFLPILKKAGEVDRVTKFFETGLKRSPGDPELSRRYAQFLFEQKQYQKASEYALASIDKSYDRNEIYAAKVYAKSLNKMGQKSQAKDFLLKYQARPDLSASSRSDIEAALKDLN